MLNSVRHTPSPDLADYIYLLYSEPGIGKTTFAIQSGALLLDFEAGYRAMDAQVISFVDSVYPDQSAPKKLQAAWAGACSWARFLIFVDWASQNELGNFKSLVLDTVDVAYDACVDYVCKKHGWSSPSDGGQYGKGWNVVNEEFQKAIRRLMALGVGLGFTSHAKVRTVVPLGMEPVDKICPSLPPSCSRWLVGLADFVFFAEATYDAEGDPVRVIRTQPSPRFEAKSRGRKDIPLPSPLALDYAQFEKAWSSCLRGELIEPLATLPFSSVRRDTGGNAASGGADNPWT